MAELLCPGSCKSGAFAWLLSVHNLSLFLVLSLPPLCLPGVHLAGEMELFFPLFGFLVTGKLSIPLSRSLFHLSHTHHDPCFAGPLAFSVWSSRGRTRTQHSDTLEKITSSLTANQASGKSCLPDIFKCIVAWSVCMQWHALFCLCLF